MPAPIDYTGRKIGRVKILSLVGRGNGSSCWKCLCDCGNEFITHAATLKRGEKFECKLCIIERRRGPDLTGRKFGRWNVIVRVIDKNNKTVWHCRCDCGNEGFISGSALGKKGKSMSCGCWGRKMKSKWANPSLYPKASGLSTTKFYHVRTQIIHKCYSERWPTYNLFGGKGITVCDLWRNSAKDMYDWAIANGWKEKTCIILKEGAQEFSPDNVYMIHNDDFRSIIGKKQGIQVEYKGEKLTLLEWSEKLNIPVGTLKSRFQRFPSLDLVFEKPYKKLKFHSNDNLKNEMVELYKKGKTFQEIAEVYGVTEQTVHYHLKKLGIEKHAWNRLNHIKDEDIVKLYNEGWKLNQIAKKYETSFTCIKYRMNRIKGIPKSIPKNKQSNLQ